MGRGEDKRLRVVWSCSHYVAKSRREEQELWRGQGKSGGSVGLRLVPAALWMVSEWQLMTDLRLCHFLPWAGMVLYFKLMGMFLEAQ